MNIKMSVLLGVLAAACAVRGGIAADAVTCERYPDADYVVVDGRIDIEYAADGTYVETDEEWIKVLTEKGRRELSTVSIDYSLRYGKGEITSVEIIGTDGVARAVDFKKTLKEATDNGSMAMNIYDPLDRVLSCAVPGIGVGETRHVRTRREVTHSRVKDQFADFEALERTMPIVKTTVTITGPEERPLRSVAVRRPLGNVTESSVKLPDGRFRRTWTVKDSPQAFPEPNMPPLFTQAQGLLVSTAKDWKEISRWYWELSLPHLRKTNAAMTNKVNEIRAAVEAKGRRTGESRREELMRAVFRFVSQEVRYMGLTMEDVSPGYAPHDVDVTFDNRYGVCRDKAALLVALLRIAGLEAYPVLISAGAAKMDEEVPLPYFNHAIVAVKEGDGYALMDPTDEAAAELMPPYLADCSYLVACPDGETLRTSPVAGPERNAVDVKGKGRLAKDGTMLVDYDVEFRGINDTAFRHRLLGMKPEDRRTLFESALQSAVSGAELLRFELNPSDLRDTDARLSVALLAKFPETLVRGRTQDALTVPSLSSGLGLANWVLSGRTSLEMRRYPLKLRSTAAANETLSVELGSAVGAAAHLPRTEALDGKYSFCRAFSATNGVLTMSRRLAIGAVEFSPDEYLELREGVKRVEACERGRCIFGKDRFADADVRYLRRERDVRLADAYSWVATDVVEKEILTYDGKRSSAELAYTFNPTWKSVEIVSAVVSNRDGRVARLTDREVNVMDADWASRAPRYPASKVLVANLPSVEIGSVVSYTTVTVVSNSPLPYYETFYGDVREPTDLLVSRCVGCGEGLEVRIAGPRVLPNEPMQPDGRLWREHRTVSLGDFGEYAKRLAPAAEVKAVSPDALGLRPSPGGVREIRDWMAKHVRIAGPGFAEVRLADHLTDPETVLKDRYATRVGYVRTLCALLKGAGHEADVVFAADDAGDSPEALKAEDETRHVGVYSHALCRVRTREGGFLGFGGTETVLFLGTENEYTPLGASAYEGARYFDPRSFDGTFDVVGRTIPAFAELRYCISLRENGAADVDFEQLLGGAQVGPFRKRYAEMLPEMRSRRFQAILGGLAQAATATGELVTDLEGYPARLSYSAYIPDYATVQGDSMTVSLPMLAARLFPLAGDVRETPIALPGESSQVLSVRVRFPAGYTKVEHLPSAFSFGDRYACRVAKVSGGEAGELCFSLVREALEQRGKTLSNDNFALLKGWNRISDSAAESTITVRK